MRISVDSSLCQGHGRCYAHAPDLFEPVDDHGHAVARRAEVSANEVELATAVGHAVIDCPERAISVE